MNIKKSYPRCKWGNLPNFLSEVELLVFNYIKAIPTFVGLQLDDNGFRICDYSIIYNSCFKKPLSYEVTYSDIAEFHRAQFSTYKHQTPFIAERKQIQIAAYPYTPIHW